jgi:hypothetical protein
VSGIVDRLEVAPRVELAVAEDVGDVVERPAGVPVA